MSSAVHPDNEQKPMFIYVIDRDGELDVFGDLEDAREASEILGVPYLEQPIFETSTGSQTAGAANTRTYLDALRAAAGLSEFS